MSNSHRHMEYKCNIYRTCKICKEKRVNSIFPSSENKIVDDFIKSTQINGGFSKIYRANWIDGPVIGWNHKEQKYIRGRHKLVALKELYDSENISSKQLNELKIYYSYGLKEDIGLASLH
ncbi:unnamed protein product [Rhizophagus irregularis]|nr:unnamed protein product [Rhizophagus irregularis]